MAYDIRFNTTQTGAETIDQIGAKMAVLKVQVAATSSEMEAGAKRVSAAQAGMVAAMAAGNTELAGQAAAEAAKHRAALESVIAKQNELKASLAGLGSAHTAMVPQVAAASAAIREFEGQLPIRAVERFAVNVLGLGPLLQKAFPLLGLFALAGMIAEVGEKVVDFARKFDPVIDAEKQAAEGAKNLDAEMKKVVATFDGAKFKGFEDVFGTPTAMLLRAQEDARKVLADQTTMHKLETRRDLIQANVTSLALPGAIGAPGSVHDEKEKTDADVALQQINEQIGQLQIQIENEKQAVSTANTDALKLGLADTNKLTGAQSGNSTAAISARESIDKDTEEHALRHRQTMTEIAIQGDKLDSTREIEQAVLLVSIAGERETKIGAIEKKAHEDRLAQLGTRRALIGADKVASKEPEYQEQRLGVDREVTAENTSYDKSVADHSAATDDANDNLEVTLAKVTREFRAKAASLLVEGVKKQTEEYAASRKKDEEGFTKGLSVQDADLSRQNEDAKKKATVENTKTTEETANAVRKNASAGAFADRMTGLNPSLTEAQKIVELNRQDMATAQQKYRIEMAGAAAMMGDAEKAKAREQAKRAAELDFQKIQQEGQERIAELQNKQITEFRGLIGGIFEAIATRQPNALPNFVKSQVLRQAGTFVENAAQQYLYPQIKKVIPGIGGPLAKGTIFEADPLKTTAAPALVTAASDLQAAAKSLAGSRSGGGSGGGWDVGAPGDPASLGTDRYGNAIPGITPSPLPDSGLSAMLALSALAKSPSSGGGGLAGFGAGAGSVLSGNGLTTLMGYGTPGVNGNPGTAPTGIEQVGAGVGIAGALAAGGYGIYSGLKQGGAGGDLKAAGSAAGLVGGIVGNVAKLMGAVSPLLSAIPVIGSIAAVALPLLGGLFNGPQQRANAINSEISSAQYIAPQSLNVTQDSSGNFADFDAHGNLRTSNFSAVPTVRQGSTWEQTHGLFGGPPTFYNVPGGQTSQFGAAQTPPVVVNHNYGPGSISTIDANSFSGLLDRSNAAVGTAAAKALQNAHGALTAEVQRAANG